MPKNSDMKVHFKVHTLRTMMSPYNKADQEESTFETLYYLLVNMKDLPDNLPLDVNPRVPKMTTNPAKNLIKAVQEAETDFYINNRGIAISAKALSFDAANSMVTINLGNQNDEADQMQYGILDGGHTYRAIISNRDKIPDGIEKYVRIEVITNVLNVSRLSDARNTSVQVSDIALFNLDDKFDYIKNVIKNQPYADRIAYKDNENKEIHISELIRLLFAFDIVKYPDETVSPIQSFSGKAQVFKRYKECYDTPFYQELTKELPKLVELYDTIEVEMPQKYGAYKESIGVMNYKFGNVRGVESLIQKDNSDRFFSFFLHRPIKYKIASGYIYPILGAFRSLLQFDKDNQKVFWLYDPLEIWNEIGVSLVQNTFETANNPQMVGKDKRLWRENYRTVETLSLRRLLKER